MKKIVSLFLLGFLLANLHAQRGRVQIQDGTLVTDKGTLLRGCYIATDGNTPMTPIKEDIHSIKNFGLNCIHLYAENSCCQFPGEKEADIDSIVKWTENDSLYLILTVGWWGGPDLGWISGFWNKYASKYKDKTHVIFEISNEPFAWNAPYDSVTLTMEKRMYDTIRFYAPETHIQFMSYAKNINADSAIMDIKSLGEGIDWNNASIAAHGYTYSAETTREFIRQIQDSGYAITITETPVIRFRPESRDFFPNMAFIRVFEEEFVSYVHFLEPNHILNSPSRYQSKIESSDIRWIPDLGNWPKNLAGINYIDPFKPIKPGFYDKDTWGVYLRDEFKIWAIDTMNNFDAHVAYYNLNFKESPDSVLLTFSFLDQASRIEIRLDSVNGHMVCNASIPHVDWETSTVFSYPLNSFEGIHNIYFVFKSTSYFSGILDNILFLKPGISSQQPPYHQAAFELPTKIEAEEYDIGGMNISYFDSTSANEGLWFRYDEVDIEATTDTDLGYNVGYIEEGEWLEYTVDCGNTYLMDIELRIACTDPGEKIRIKLNDQILGTVTLPNTGGWQNWEIVTLEDVIIPAGDNQILRLEFLDSGFNLNWMNFIVKEVVSLDEITNKKLITFYPNPASDYLTIQSPEGGYIEIYSMQGQLLLTKEINKNRQIISIDFLKPGNYIVKLVSHSITKAKILTVN